MKIDPDLRDLLMLAFTLIAIAISVVSVRLASRSARAAKRSAGASEQSAKEAKRANDRLDRLDAKEAMHWRIEPISGGLFRLIENGEGSKAKVRLSCADGSGEYFGDIEIGGDAKFQMTIPTDRDSECVVTWENADKTKGEWVKRYKVKQLQA